jgi:hypothetical protein
MKSQKDLFRIDWGFVAIRLFETFYLHNDCKMFSAFTMP